MSEYVKTFPEKIWLIVNEIKKELEKPTQVIFLSCKSIGAAYSIGKESQQRKPLDDDEIIRLSCACWS